MDQQIFIHDDTDPAVPDVIVADNVLSQYADDIIDSLNAIYGGIGTPLHFHKQDQP